MALGTGSLAMAGSLPGIDVNIHLMAEAAEGGGFCKFEERGKENQGRNAAEKNKDCDSLAVGASPLSRCLEQLDPECLDCIKKIVKRFHPTPPP
jgi:hypothetical protein